MIVLLLLLLQCCSFQPLGTDPLSRDPANSRIVAIVATNDIHGHALPLNLTRVDTKQSYTQGGLATLAALIKIVKKEYPGNTLYFDCGDQFQGGVESSPLLAGGKLLNSFMDYMQVDGAAIGNHEFDYGYQYLQDFLKSRKTANLAANIQDSSGHNLLFPKQKLSQIYTLSNGIKIGAIGLTTKFTPKRSTGWVLKDKQIQGIQFRDYSEIVQSESARLRSLGANAVVLVSHVGDPCHISDFVYGLWSKKSKLPECNKQGQINKLLQSLPKGTLDAVLQGHYHEIVHNYIEGVPVMGNRAGGKYFNILYLKFEGKELVDSIIEGPIPVCEKVFRSTLQCQYIEAQNELASAGDLVSWRFHDSLVIPDQTIQRLMKQQLSDKIQPFLEVVCYNQKLLKPSYNEETQFNNLLGLAVQSQVPTADFTLLAPSLLRQTLYPGPITKLDLFNFHPFNSPFVVIKLRGEDFVNSLKYLQTLEDSYHFSNQLEQNLWMTKNGQKRGLTSVRWYNGSQIDPKAELTGVMHNFTLGFVQKQFNITRQRSFGIVRQVLETYLRRKQRIQKSWVLVDRLKPRLIIKVVQEQAQG